MVGLALGAGQHGVVVMRHGDAALLGPEQRAVHAADAGDQSVGRRLLDQVVDGAARALAGDGEGAPLDEAAGIDQVVEILPRRALVGLAPARPGVGPLVVERERAAFEILGKVGPDMVEVDLLLGRRAFHVDVGLLDEQQRMAFVDRLAGLDRDPPHVAARRTADLMLHLHGVHDQERLAGGDGVALLHGDADDRALHRRGHRHGSLRRVLGHLGGRLGGRLAERQHRQRIDGIDPRAGLPRAAGRRCRDGLEIKAGLQLGRRVQKLPGMLVDEARMDLVGAEIAMRQQGAQEGDVAGRPFQPEGGKRTLGARERVGEIGRRAVHDHLGQQRIEIGIGAVAGIAVGVDPHARARGWLEHRERAAARLGRTVRRHGLHVDPELDRMAARRGAFEAGLGQARATRQQAAAPSPDRRPTLPPSPCARPAGADWPR